MRKLRLATMLVLVATAALASGASSAERPSRYIVVFKQFATPEAAPAAHELAGRYGARAEAVFEHALKGFAVSLPPGLAARLADDERVAYVEPDVEFTTMTTQTGATWGLDRIDQRALPLSGTYSYTFTGAGVKAYIIDTGIRFGHAEFGGRAISGFDAVDGGSADDCHGHGTHVAGTVGGSTYGVAIDVPLIVFVALLLVCHADVIETPGANQSTQLPRFEKDARRSFASVAPIVIAAPTRAGEKLQAFAFEFPAATA